MMTLETFKNQAAALPPCPLAAATSYQQRLAEMTAFVDAELRTAPDISTLIGANPLQLMYDNHRHHGAFMATVLTLDSYEMLTTTLPWVYRAYHGRGFSYAYFPRELRAWIAAIHKFLPDADQPPVSAIYQWMIDQHQNIIELSGLDLDPPEMADQLWLERKNEFRVAALRGDHRHCVKMSANIVTKADDIQQFYLQVLQPVLHEIGILWEKNKISVAQEHLVSSIAGRVMATFNQLIEAPKGFYGRAVVAACANEYHELGALMIADMLELNQWEVSYLGANVPIPDLLEQLRLDRPGILALSVTMAFNVSKVRDTIAALRRDPTLAKIKVIVGGKVFSDNPDLWRLIGADYCAPDLAAARQLLHSLRQAA